MNLTDGFRAWFVADTPEHPMSAADMANRKALLARLEKMTPEEVRAERDAELKTLGGTGSGNFGHAGRPGEVGGSTTESRGFDNAKFTAMKGEWAQINDEIFQRIDTPDSPEVRALIDRQQVLVKEMWKLDADPGGLEGIGLPGGPKDVVVIGAGPGGLSAGIMGGFEGLETTIIEADLPGGQAKKSSRIENYPGFPVGVTGEQLASNMRVQAERAGAEIKTGLRAVSMTHDDATGLHTVTLSNGETITARTVIIAGGLEARSANFLGAEKADIHYDSSSLTKAGKGKRVVVAGGSNGAAQAALSAAQDATHVTVISRNPISNSMSAYAVNGVKSHPRISTVEGKDIKGWSNGRLSLSDGSSIDADTIGVFHGSAPKTEWLPQGVGRSKNGKIVTDSGGATSIPGVFAIGDVRADREGIGRIGVAVGDGQIAIHGVFQHFSAQKKAKGVQ